MNMDDLPLDGERVFNDVVALVTASMHEIDIGDCLMELIRNRDTAVAAIAVLVALLHSTIDHIADEIGQTDHEVWSQIAGHLAAMRSGLMPPEE